MIPRLYAILALSSSLVAAAPTHATVVIPDGTIIGAQVNGVEYFRGIPYAAAPIGSRRLRPPIPLASGFGTLDATGIGPSCPQMAFADIPPLFYQAISDPVVAAGLFLGSNVPGTETEDCLTVSVSRPKGTAPGAKLPVLFWMHGGGFQIGSGQPYNASVLIPRGVETGKPFILVTVNYRLSAFGFLGGKEVKAAGVANLGLLDQRRALEWVADNIAAFGGDPNAVTLWGESAGALSVFDQMALYDGNNKYKGRALFRAGIMNSGSIHLPDPVDGDRAQAVFDAVYTSVASASNCTANQDKLECLRQADYQTFLTASNKVPIFLSYNSIALSYGPRPDGKTLTASPDELVKTKKFAKVPLIVGDVEDEGTVFALYQANITTEAALKTYLGTVILPHASASQINALVATYPFKNGTAGAPFGQPDTPGPYPEFKRIGAILGDQLFLLARRFFLENLPANMPAWSFLATWERDTPLVGTFHTDDLPRMFYGVDDASRAMQDRFIAFTGSMDPNKGIATAPKGHRSAWPLWREGKALLELAKNETKVVKDDFRKESYKVFKDNIKSFRN